MNFAKHSKTVMQIFLKKDFFSWIDCFLVTVKFNSLDTDLLNCSCLEYLRMFYHCPF